MILYILAIALLSFFQGYFLRKAAVQLSDTLRNSFVESLLSQETAFFEAIDLESLPGQITEKFDNLSSCIESKIGSMVFAFGAIFSALIISLYISPGYTLALFLAFPSLICLSCMRKYFSVGSGNYNAKDDNLYNLASDTMRAIKILIASGQESRTIQRFEELREEK